MEYEVTSIKITDLLSKLSVSVEKNQYDRAIDIIREMKSYWSVFKVSQGIEGDEVDKAIRKLEVFLTRRFRKAKQAKDELLYLMRDNGVVIL